MPPIVHPLPLPRLPIASRPISPPTSCPEPQWPVAELRQEQHQQRYRRVLSSTGWRQARELSQRREPPPRLDQPPVMGSTSHKLGTTQVPRIPYSGDWRRPAHPPSSDRRVGYHLKSCALCLDRNSAGFPRSCTGATGHGPSSLAPTT
jgi:hypothetical protein